MKDVPTEFPEGLHLAVICKREDPRDAFITGRGEAASRAAYATVGAHLDEPTSFNNLKATAAVIGTSSLRRFMSAPSHQVPT